MGDGMHGEYKTPGGKLVVVDFDSNSGVLRDVRVSGDFFLYPEDALDLIVAALEGLPADASQRELAQAIEHAVDSRAEMVGFSPEAVATAIERGRSHAALD